VVVFLAIIAVIAFFVSQFSQSMRSQISRSHHGYELVELCDSAINEAGAQITEQDIFPPGTFGDYKNFLFGVYMDDAAFLTQTLNGYTPIMGKLVDPSGQPKEQIWCGMTWPKDYKIEKPVPRTEEMAKSIGSFKGPLGNVTARVVVFHRDYVKQMWQNWGIVELKISASADDNGHTITRTMYADRMFALNVIPKITAGMPPSIDVLYVSFNRSDRNLRTVIERS
jgi:hypothetical protein